MLEPNTLIQDRYLIVNLLGKGGMGAVYLAVDNRLGHAVALKQILSASDDLHLLKAFEREARLLAHLRHSNLPKVSDYFADNGLQYLVMEYISGKDLYALLLERGTAFPVPVVLDWADRILAVLEYLHAQTPPVVHRDIKPHNLKLSEAGEIFLLDFGLAKGTQTQLLTPASKSLVGYTPHYAPLEQVRGDHTSAQTDLYSLSATLYHLLTAAPPPDSLSRAQAVIEGAPDPLHQASEINFNISAEISDFLTRGMALRRETRFGSASEMRRTLQSLNGGAALDSQPGLPSVEPNFQEAATVELKPLASQPQNKSASATVPQPRTGETAEAAFKTGATLAPPAKQKPGAKNVLFASIAGGALLVLIFASVLAFRANQTTGNANDNAAANAPSTPTNVENANAATNIGGAQNSASNQSAGNDNSAGETEAPGETTNVQPKESSRPTAAAPRQTPTAARNQTAPGTPKPKTNRNQPKTTSTPVQLPQ